MEFNYRRSSIRLRHRGLGECNYTDPNITTLGPDGPGAPGHVFRDDLLNWNIGQFDPMGGDDNPCALAPASSPGEIKISEIRIDQPSTDNDEYFEICNTGMTAVNLSNYSYVVIGDGSGASGVIEAVISLSGSIPAGDCLDLDRIYILLRRWLYEHSRHA